MGISGLSGEFFQQLDCAGTLVCAAGEGAELAVVVGAAAVVAVDLTAVSLFESRPRQLFVNSPMEIPFTAG